MLIFVSFFVLKCTQLYPKSPTNYPNPSTSKVPTNYHIPLYSKMPERNIGVEEKIQKISPITVLKSIPNYP